MGSLFCCPSAKILRGRGGPHHAQRGVGHTCTCTLPACAPHCPHQLSAVGLPGHGIHRQVAPEIEVGAVPFEHGFFGRPDPGLGFVPLGLLTLRHEARGDAGDSEICGVHQVDAMALFADTPDRHCGGGASFCTVVRNAEGELCTRDAVQLGFRAAVGDTPPFRHPSTLSMHRPRLGARAAAPRTCGPIRVQENGIQASAGPTQSLRPIAREQPWGSRVEWTKAIEAWAQRKGVWSSAPKHPASVFLQS